jgi:hypothetical protein
VEGICGTIELTAADANGIIAHAIMKVHERAGICDNQVPSHFLQLFQAGPLLAVVVQLVTREWRARQPPATSIGTRVMTDLDALRRGTKITQRLSCGRLTEKLTAGNAHQRAALSAMICLWRTLRRLFCG